MKAIAVKPGVRNSIHLVEMPAPSLSEIPNGRGVLVKVLRVGVDGTDKEINNAEYGAPPVGFDFLVLGHEGFGIVEETGENVHEFKKAITSSPPCGGREIRFTTSSGQTT